MKKKVKDAEKVSAWDAQAVASQGPTCKVPPVTNGGVPSWAESVLGGGSRRLAVLIGAAGLCLCFYAILAIFTSHPCWHSLHCSRKLVTGRHAVLHDDEIAGHNHHKSPLSAKYEPLNLPAQGRAFATSSSSSTNLSHIVFGIAASSSLWNRRKEYIKLWWRPREMRGFVWLDKPVNRTSDDTLLPPVRISPDTSRFKYTNKLGRRSAIRISRIVSDTFRLGLPDVDWFVMGDDDTLFIPENLVKVLSKYDHRQYYYIGSTSESHLQNIMFSYNMAYGGGGFAISYPLAKALEKMQDGCLERYPSLFGSDDRIQACMSELGVPLTREAGFHQYDIYGNLFGLIATHPITPAVSLHHLDVVEPIFPNKTRVQSLRRLQKSIKADPYGFLQQSICYDSENQWSISLSWGFALQIYRGIFLPRELELPPRTFYNWHKKGDHTAYAFNTRPFSRNPCQKPFIFYMHNISSSANKTGWMESMYYKEEKNPPECKWKMASPETLQSVKVVKQKDDSMWNKGPRRKCCHVAASASTSTTLEINVRDCEPGEVATADNHRQGQGRLT